MSKAIIMKGLPGSGKSTRASQQDGYIIFSRDTTREQNPDMNESEIHGLELSFIESNAGKNIIIDNTHMNKDTLYCVLGYCKLHGYDVEVKDMIGDLPTRSYLALCIERNKNREKYVPVSVIHQMYLQEYTIDGDVVIVDIDGTIANLDHRLHYIKQSPKDYEAFYKEIGNDTPINQTIELVNDLYDKGYTIVLTSGRSNITCKDTIERLHKYHIPYDHILMRQSRDRRDDVIMKREIYYKCLLNKNVYMVFDDRPRVVKMWRELGLFTIDVNQRGDF